MAPARMRRREEHLREARQALGPARARSAEDRGTAMSWATAAEYALTLTVPGPQQPQPAPALAKLSAREQELVTLVAQGRTNAEIAAELYISIRTRQLAPGPDPGQDRLPPPRRPDPPGPQPRPCLTTETGHPGRSTSALWSVSRTYLSPIPRPAHLYRAQDPDGFGRPKSWSSCLLSRG